MPTLDPISVLKDKSQLDPLQSARLSAMQKIQEGRALGVTPSSQVVDPGATAKAKMNFGKFLSYMAMGVGEGLTGRPFLTGYEQNRLEREKIAKDEAVEMAKLRIKEAGMPMENLLKTAESINAAVALNIITPEQAKELSMQKETLKSEVTSAVSANKALTGTGKFLDQFERSYKELKGKFPDIGKEGVAGWLERKGASIANYFDELPETKAFQTELLPLANQTARDIEGGRITDQDRQVYADAMASAIKHPSKTNIRLVSNALIGLRDKGGDISKVMDVLSTSKTDIIQEIVKNVKGGIDETTDVSKFGLNPDEWEMVK